MLGINLIECDDNDSVSGNFSLLSLVDRTPGEILSVNAWGIWNDAFWNVSPYDWYINNSTSGLYLKVIQIKCFGSAANSNYAIYS
jgi:hypothetical protein